MLTIFNSSLNSDNRFQSFDASQKWINEIVSSSSFKVEQIPLKEIKKWCVDTKNGKIVHESGHFFSVEGIRVNTNFAGGSEWDQPIINQPETGILGIITKVFNNTRYFLMQAKMEPGNINILQLSPTLQATKSNFSRIHKGKTPDYFEYFSGEHRVNILFDQLQSEQGSFFYKKRNRNIVVEVYDDIPVLDHFHWFTLAELKVFLKKDNLINMDARSVLSIIPLLDEKIMGTLGQNGISRLLSENKDIITDTGQEYLLSMTTKNSIHTIYQLLSWYNRQKINYDLNVIKKSLFQLENWEIDAYSIKSSQKTFSVIGVAVSAGTREVNHWMQPLLKDQNIGLNVFFIKKIGGVIHFLIQARVEAGVKDIIELYPTISCFNYNNIISEMEKPFLFDEIFNPTNIIHYDSIQSEEGGRFFQIQNRNMIIQADFDDDKIPSNYIWVTLRQINEFIRYGLFGIEARSLLSAISFI